ncbi:SDR family NAD(P)-dependent oxidoreductase [Streptomyces sp. NPDC052236]|uniref:SDR family NAD(P)-dependent oxidoreductase n=1 Tax=Streptomyces sp. NPDC052236 TaxID=3365686 RepID=UPI0037D918E4
MNPFRSKSALASLSGRVCLVTGGAAGIGWALTRALVTAGAHVHVCDNSRAGLERAAADLAQLPGKASVRFAEVDVTDRAALEGWIAEVHAERGRIDVLVHNAAYIQWADVEEMSVEQAQLSMRTAYDALVYSVKAVLPLMRAGGGGQIVAMGSAAGRVFVKGPSAAYAAAKAAIEAYTEMLRIELAGSGIGVTLVRPATVAGTDFFKVHVPSSRMPRITDFLPATSPEKVAAATVAAIGSRRPTVDIPGYLPSFYRAYAMAPELTRKAASTGGSSRRDYALPRPRPADVTSARSDREALGGTRTDGIALRVLKKAGENVRFVRVMSHVAPGIDRAAHRLSGGRMLLMPAMLPSLMLTTTGRLSGQPRQTPLLCHLEADGSYLVVDSNFGRTHHPAWSHNLQATPRASITRRGHTQPVNATLLEGSERTAAWDHLVQVWPAYVSFAQRSGRCLRVFRLTPA